MQLVYRYASGLMELLTFKAVEDRVVRRVTNKAGRRIPFTL
jgi:hypothetical protein